MLYSRSFKLDFNSTWTKNFQKYKLGLEKAEEPKIKLPTFPGSWRKQGNSRKTSTSASLTMLKLLTGVDHYKLWKILQEMGTQDHHSGFCWQTWMQDQKQQLGLDMEQQIQTGSKLRKLVCQGCILSPYLFNLYAEHIMRNAKLDDSQLESRLPGEISTISYMQMTPPLWQKSKRN